MPIEDRIRGIISQTLGITDKQVSAEDKLVDLVTDSIQLFELLIRLENEFQHKVKYEDIAHIEKVKDITEYIHRVGLLSVPTQ